MNKYCIISFIYEGEINADCHDITINDIEKLSKKGVREAGKKGVSLYFKEVYNERIIGDSFAMVEYNFDMSNQEKTRLIEFITKFFGDWDLDKEGIVEVNTLKAVRFLKVDGEIVNIN